MWLPRKGTGQDQWPIPRFLLAIEEGHKRSMWLEYYSAIKKNEIPITEQQENIRLIEINQAQRDKYCLFLA